MPDQSDRFGALRHPRRPGLVLHPGSLLDPIAHVLDALALVAGAIPEARWRAAGRQLEAAAAALRRQEP